MPDLEAPEAVAAFDDWFGPETKDRGRIPSSGYRYHQDRRMGFLAGYKAAATSRDQHIEKLEKRLGAVLSLLNRPEIMAVIGVEELASAPLPAHKEGEPK